MNSYQKLIHHLEYNKEDRKKVINCLRYSNFPKGSHKLLTKLRNKTITKKDLELISNLLDLNSSEILQDLDFIKKTISNEKKYLEEINYLKRQIKQRDNFKPYIYIETVEKRPSNIAIVSLIYNSLKYIKNLPENILEYSRKEQKEFINILIKKHYIDKNGEIFSFGKITGYKYYYSFNNFISFDF